MGNGKKVSIVVPIYQKEDYIDKAVKSLLQQTYSPIEILLIDDGSKDQSLFKCREWEKREANIRTYHHENKGVSYTRNIGIIHADGDYIMFMDSDDTLVENAVERMVCELEQSQADVCICGYYRERENKLIDYIPDVFGVFSRIQFIEKQFKELYQKHILHNIGTKIYKRDVLLKNSIHFLEGHTVCEDISFCLEYIKVSQTICVINEPLYIYYYDDVKSVNHNYRKDFWDNIFELDRSIAEIIGQTELYYTIVIRNIYEAFRNELLANPFDKYRIRKKLYSVYGNEDIMQSIGKVKLAELTLEERFFIIMLWHKQCWLIYIMLKIKHMKAKGKIV